MRSDIKSHSRAGVVDRHSSNTRASAWSSLGTSGSTAKHDLYGFADGVRLIRIKTQLAKALFESGEDL